MEQYLQLTEEHQPNRQQDQQQIERNFENKNEDNGNELLDIYIYISVSR